MSAIKNFPFSRDVELRGSEKKTQLRLITQAGSRTRFSDPLTSLYGAVRPLIDKQHIILHFISALSGEGVSTTAREFAAMASKRGHRRTLLVDANTHSPISARMFGCPADRGILDDVREHRSVEQSLGSATPQGFWVGSLLGTQMDEALRPDEVRQAYEQFKSQFDLTIIDCAAVADGHYPDLMPELTDGVIMVIQAESTRPAVVTHARTHIEQLGGHVIGAVLNRRKDYIPEAIYRYL